MKRPISRLAATTHMMNGKECWLRFFLGFVLAVVPTEAQETKKGVIHTVRIKDFEFVLVQLSVHPGETVVWTNEDIIPHTVTAKGGFNSKEIGPKKSWTYKPARKGTFPYICTYHPTMKGELTVK